MESPSSQLPLATLKRRANAHALRDGQLRFCYPESAKHPYQAYVASGEEDTHD